MKRRVVFLGEKPLGHRCLELLHRQPDVEIVGVCTRGICPEVWWGRQLVREHAVRHRLPLLRRRDLLTLGRIDSLISVLYPFLIEPDVLATTRGAAVNLHQAPLPEYRGCNGASHAIINGEETWGGTLHLLADQLDSGNIIEKRCFPIRPDITSRELYEENDENCFAIFRDNLRAVLENVFEATPQNLHTPRHTYNRDSLSSKQASPGWDDETLDRFVRGHEFPPFEPAYFLSDGEKRHLTRSSWRQVRESITCPDSRCR